MMLKSKYKPIIQVDTKSHSERETWRIRRGTIAKQWGKNREGNAEGVFKTSCVQKYERIK